MLRVKEIANKLNHIMPITLKESWDNVGLLIGDEDTKVNKVLMALDLTDEVIDEAIKIGSNMIFTHHPIIFKPISAVNTSEPVGRKIIKCIKNNISVYTAHTNLDSCKIGTNEVLFNRLKLNDKKTIDVIDEQTGEGLGRIGTLAEQITLKQFLDSCINEFEIKNINYSSDYDGLDKSIKTVALCTGSLMQSMIIKSKSMGADVFVTGDLTFHSGQLAKDYNIAIVDLTHYTSENIVFAEIEKYIKELGIEVYVSNVNGQTVKSYGGEV